MKLLSTFAIMLSVITLMGCGSSTSVNVNARGANASPSNMNRMATPSPAPTIDRKNADVSRDDYDKNRGEYEKDRGTSTVGQGINDSWIWFKTKAALATADELRDSTINVDVVNDKITLKGTVANAAQKMAAEKVAKTIEGQTGVKNELMVKPTDSMTNQMVNGNTSMKSGANANKR